MTALTGNDIGRHQVTVGDRVELGRYRTRTGEEHVLQGQRVGSVVRITDRPAGSGGRAYLVERGLEQDGYDALKALVVDYLSVAERLGTVPMAVSPTEHFLEHLS